MRTLVAVPMLKENRPVGVIGVYRREVRAFSDKQIELVTNFAGAGRHRCRERAATQAELQRSRSNSRPPPPTCSRSSAAPPST